MSRVCAPIFSRGSDNKTIRYWHYEVSGSAWRGHYGIVGGKDATSKWSTAKTTNAGKTNERLPETQAQFEAEAEERKKLAREYRRDVADLHEVPDAVMLAQDYLKLKKPLIFDPFHIAAQPKLDGFRLVGERRGGYSREFQPFGDAIIHIREALAPVFEKHPDLVLDGELYNHTLKHDFNKLSSVIRKDTLTPDQRREAQRLIEYHVYDIPSRGDLNFADRHAALIDLFGEFDFSLEPIVLVPTIFPANLTELDDAYIQWLAEGYEGEMVRVNEPYGFGTRSWALMKRKTHVTQEVEVTRVIEGNGNWAGLAKAIEFKMPSGALTEKGELPKAGLRGDEDFCRALLLQDPPPKMATIRHLGLTPGGVPRGPVAIDFDRKE